MSKAAPSARYHRSPLSLLTRSTAAYRIAAGFSRGVWALVRKLGPERGPALASRLARLAAPLIPETRLGRANLAAAFPDKGEAERNAILTGAWDSIARTSAEMALIGELASDLNRFELIGLEHFFALRDDGKPGIVFTAHIGNWEVLAVLGRQQGLEISSLYTPPRNPFIDADVLAQRSALMGPLIPNRAGAAAMLASTLERGGHVGVLVDQRKRNGAKVQFFGQSVDANPLVARLARTFDCPVVGAHSVRLPGGRFRVEVTPPLDLARDAEGKIDVLAATQQINSVVEGWVRQTPEQWLWMHNRWGRGR